MRGYALRLPRDPPRRHGDLHAALAAVREVLPHLPAAGAARRRVLQGCRRARGQQARCRRCGSRTRPRSDGRRPDRPSSGNSASATRWTRPRGPTTTSRSAPRAGARSSDSRRATLWRQRAADGDSDRVASSRARSTSFAPSTVRISAGWTGRPASTRASSRTGSSRPTAASAASSAASSSRSRTTRSIGFEPWEDFPFNRGMLCPKGVKRYLQGSHPDRLLTALARDPAATAGSAHAVRRRRSRRRRAEIERIQQRTAPARSACSSGASLTTEKTYLHGQVRARLPEDAVTSTTTAGSAW